MKEIPLSQGLFALVDDEDYDELMKYKWFASVGNKNTYACRNCTINGKHKTIMMHRQIKNNDNLKLFTDHIDGNGLNNCKSNLRIVTKRQNAQNLHIEKTSKYAGVYFSKKRKRFISTIRFGKKRFHLGSFIIEEEAHKAYLSKLLEIGEVFVDNI